MKYTSVLKLLHPHFQPADVEVFVNQVDTNDVDEAQII